MSRIYLIIGEIAFVGGILLLAYFLFNTKPPAEGAVAVNIKTSDSLGQVYLQPKGNGYVYLIKHADGQREELPADQLAGRLYSQSQARGIASVLGPTSPGILAWLAIGLAGQILFTGRMVVQWIASEKKKKSIVPPLFWWMSLIGSLMLLSYFLWRRDPIGLLGQLFGAFIYLRNIWLIYGKHHPGKIGMTKESVQAA